MPDTEDGLRGAAESATEGASKTEDPFASDERFRRIESTEDPFEVAPVAPDPPTDDGPGSASETDEVEDGYVEDEDEHDEDDERAGSSIDALEFAYAESDEAAQSCQLCKGALGNEYYDADGAVICGACANVSKHGDPGDSRFMRIVRSGALGAAAALVSALVWYGVAEVTGYEIGLLAIGVGLLVGFAVRLGSRAMGGWFYQGLAMLLTYGAIVVTYVPAIADGIQHPEPDPGELSAQGGIPDASPATGHIPDASPPAEETIPYALALIIALFLAPFAPFFAGLENIIGLLLIGIALWEAWKLNKRPIKKLTGPFALHAAPEP